MKNQIDERRENIRAAINALPLMAGAPVDLVIDRIEWMLDQAASAVDVMPTTPGAAAKELDRVGAALRELEAAMMAMSKPAREALNHAKFRRGLTWPPDHSKWSFMRSGEFAAFLALYYPRLKETASEAAADLRYMKAAGDRPKRIKAYPLALAALLAGSYEALTGTSPGRGRSNGRFAAFVGEIFDSCAGIEVSAEHYARLGAEMHEQRRGENPPEISWYHSP